MQMQPEIQLLCDTRVIIYRDYSDITVLISPQPNETTRLIMNKLTQYVFLFPRLKLFPPLFISDTCISVCII